MKFITKKMIFSFSVVLLVQISSAFVNISQYGVKMYYNITSTNLCHSKAGRFSVKQGLSVSQCVEECGLRKHCAALSYKRRNNFCELFLFTENVDLRRGGCIFINASDLAVAEMPCGNDCMYGEMCDPFLKACIQKECLNVTAPTKGEIFGNRYGVGDMLKYECTRGYRERNDFVNTVCLETGSWNASADCVMDCENPPYIQNGRVASVGMNSANVICSLGYMSAKTMINCTNSGSWNVNCDLIECGEQPAINNGIATLDTINGTYYLSTATVTCDVGYQSVGPVGTTIVCEGDGSWTTVTCNPIDCGEPPAITNGIAALDTIDGTYYLNTATVTCDTGYQSVGTTIVCDEDGSWTIVICNPIECGDPPAITNGIAALDTIDGTYYLDTATVTCDIGYQSVVTTIVCTEDGSWTTVTCYPIACGNPPAVVKGTAVLDNDNGVYYLDTATVTCDDWYQIESNKIKCTISGIWETATCIDCYSAAPQEYIGRTNITLSGIQCQRWDSQSPHSHTDTDLQYFPDPTLAAANNYCRTPEPGDYDPWCYTINTEVEWEHCNVPKCSWS